MQRGVGDVAELTVRLHHHRHIRCLDADLVVGEPDLVEVRDLLQCALDHRLRLQAVVLLVEGRVQRTTVDTDANRQATILRLGSDRLDVLGPADVARVQPQAVHASFHRCQRHFVLVVDVGDDRNRRAWHNLGEPLGRLRLVARAAHDVAASGRERIDLLQRALNVGRLGDGHRLHRDRCAAADGHLSYEELPSGASFEAHGTSVPAPTATATLSAPSPDDPVHNRTCHSLTSV